MLVARSILIKCVIADLKEEWDTALVCWAPVLTHCRNNIMYVLIDQVPAFGQLRWFEHHCSPYRWQSTPGYSFQLYSGWRDAARKLWLPLNDWLLEPWYLKATWGYWSHRDTQILSILVYLDTWKWLIPRLETLRPPTLYYLRPWCFSPEHFRFY